MNKKAFGVNLWEVKLHSAMGKEKGNRSYLQGKMDVLCDTYTN